MRVVLVGRNGIKSRMSMSKQRERHAIGRRLHVARNLAYVCREATCARRTVFGTSPMSIPEQTRSSSHEAGRSSQSLMSKSIRLAQVQRSCLCEKARDL